MSEQLLPQEYQLQRELLEQLLAPQPTVIGIEGGPCSGKTTLIGHVAQEAERQDRPVVILPEAATQHIAKLEAAGMSVGELAANDRKGFIAFETDVLGTIVEQIETAKEQYAGTDAIIVADRVDIAAYLAEAEHRQVLDNLGLDKAPMLSLVDQLYYLPSVARESLERYDELKVSNPARYESGEQAVTTCEANLRAVGWHPELHILWGGDFERKISEAKQAILAPEREIELKLNWLDSDWLQDKLKRAAQNGDLVATHSLTQSYHRLDNAEFRLRQTTTQDHEVIYHFALKTGEGVERQELSRLISKECYARLKATPQIGRTLTKVRYQCLMSDWLPNNKRLWSVDFYPEPHLLRWDVEIPLSSADDARHVLPNGFSHESGRCRPSAVSARQLAGTRCYTQGESW